jgi:hypothetical protein
METAAEDTLKLPVGHRALWWIADDQAELDVWKKDFAEKGCVIHRMEPHPAPSTQIDVLFSLDPTKAEAALGYPPEESEWLEE